MPVATTVMGAVGQGVTMQQEEATPFERRLIIPREVPEDFAHSVATILLLGIGGADLWENIYRYSPEVSLSWIGAILDSNETRGLVHTDLRWWECQLKGH